jgi:hypothetical protein
MHGLDQGECWMRRGVEAVDVVRLMVCWVISLALSLSRVSSVSVTPPLSHVFEVHQIPSSVNEFALIY